MNFISLKPSLANPLPDFQFSPSKFKQTLKVLLDKATIAGQLYALCGLYDADYQFFLTVVEKYKIGDASVKTLSGCVGREEYVREVVFLDEPNTVRLSSPTQPFNEWREKAKLSDREGFRVDISGGGYPMFFRGRSSDR